MQEKLDNLTVTAEEQVDAATSGMAFMAATPAEMEADGEDGPPAADSQRCCSQGAAAPDMRLASSSRGTGGSSSGGSRPAPPAAAPQHRAWPQPAARQPHDCDHQEQLSARRDSSSFAPYHQHCIAGPCAQPATNGGASAAPPGPASDRRRSWDVQQRQEAALAAGVGVDGRSDDGDGSDGSKNVLYAVISLLGELSVGDLQLVERDVGARLEAAAAAAEAHSSGWA